MRKAVLITLAMLLAAGLLAGCSYSAPASNSSGGGSTTASKSASVEISGFAFNPSSVEVAVGGTVTWTNKDSATHTVTGDGWKSGDLAQGATYSNTFDKAGTYAYACSIHPSMKGEITVK